MAFRASNVIPARAYESAKAEALKLQNLCNQISSALGSDISAETLPVWLVNLQRFRTRLNDVRSVTGIAQYAKDQEDDQAYDVAAEFNSLISLVDAAITEIQATNTNALISTWSVSSGLIWNTFTPAQTAALKADIDAIVAQVS